MAKKVDVIECPHCQEYVETGEVNGFEAYECPTCEELYDSEEEADNCCKNS